MLLRRCIKPKLSLFVPLWISIVSVLAAPPASPTAATTTPVQHMVVIFQENVSFDHYFATYPVAANNSPFEPAFTAAPGTPTVNGLSGPLLTHNPKLRRALPAVSRRSRHLRPGSQLSRRAEGVQLGPHEQICRIRRFGQSSLRLQQSW